MKALTRIAVISLSLFMAFPLLPKRAAAWESEGLRIRGRLQARFEMREDGDRWTNTFRLRRARVDARWDVSDMARLVLELEGAGGLEVGPGVDLPNAVQLKDAYGRLKLHQAMKITAGQFKKPFSRLKMTSPFKLLVPSRGLLNKYAVAQTSHGGYGGRDIGVMVSGKVKQALGLRYYIGAFNGPGFMGARDESHRDYVARLRIKPVKGLKLAANVSHKLYDTFDSTRTVNLFGADAEYKIAGLTLQAEAAFGDNVDAGRGSLLVGVHGIAGYKITLTDDLVLTLAAMVEWFDPDDQVSGGSGLRIAGALNLDMLDAGRLVVCAEGTHGTPRAWDPEQARAVPLTARTRVFVQLDMSF